MAHHGPATSQATPRPRVDCHPATPRVDCHPATAASSTPPRVIAAPSMPVVLAAAPSTPPVVIAAPGTPPVVNVIAAPGLPRAIAAPSTPRVVIAAPSTPPILPPTPISPVTTGGGGPVTNRESTGVSTACGGYTVCGGHNFFVSLCQHTLKSARPVTEPPPSLWRIRCCGDGCAKN